MRIVVLRRLLFAGVVFAGLLGAGLTVSGQTGASAGNGSRLKLSADVRLLIANHENAQLIPGNDYLQAQFRGIVGAEWRWSPRLRVLGEVGTGQVVGRRDIAVPALQNAASLQQLYFEFDGKVGSTPLGAIIGRQKFADGPRQLLSVGDGANLHRTWNGVRLQTKGARWRAGAFDLRATRLGRRAFDDGINEGERLQGINASLGVIPVSSGTDLTLDPFWLHSDNAAFRSGGRTGLDRRDTYGARLRGRRGVLSFDWTVARQTGEFMQRDVDGWGVFAVQSVVLANTGWKPSLTSHVDLASGGGAYGTGRIRGFNPLYSSSGYLGEGRFLNLSNLLLIAPGVSVTPTPKLKLAFEYGFARRLAESDAVYGGGMRAYAGTQNVPGHDIGGLMRLSGSFAASRQLMLLFSFERLFAGDILKRAGLPSGTYRSLAVSYQY